MKNERKAARWLIPLELHAFPTLGDTPITELMQIDIKGCISPIWKTKNETASNSIPLEYSYKTCDGTWYRCGYAIKSKSFIRKVYSKYQNIPAMSWKEMPKFFQS
ncbi:phage integrase central domain-containing protein [Bartonella sp. TT29SHDZB]|uniref:phage integrase central domain-containing protein n=1 Tax=Bartonella sp. TT29SHDZB TaxID=3243581 RepID=UPI0035CF6460